MEENKKLVWWVVIIVIVLIIAAFAVYYMQTGVYSPGGATIFPPSDTTSSIEADLKATDLNNLDTELSDIGKELAK